MVRLCTSKVKEFDMLWFFICLAGIVIVFFKMMPSKSSTRAAAVEPIFSWPELDEFGTKVVGESFYQSALKVIVIASGHKRKDYEAIPARAVLVPESDNQHDVNAVRVDISGLPVGHLSRKDAKKYRAALVKVGHGVVPAECKAAITGGFKMDNGKQAHFGVVLCVPPLE